MPHPPDHFWVGQLKRALLVPPAEGLAEAAAWREFGYHHAPDSAAALREHEGFAAVLRAAGVEVHLARDPHPARLDAVFAFDPLVVSNVGAITARMGKPLRRGEESTLAAEVEALGVPILGTLTGDATLEGGDTLWLDPDTLIVGRSYRTNDEGFAQIRAILRAHGKDAIQVHLPHWHGRDEILHLMSLISPVADNLALVYPSLLPIPLAEMLAARGVEQVIVPDDEFLTLGCNALAVAPGHVVMARGNPHTVAQLRAHGVEVSEYAGAELCLNRDGGPTCLTCCLEREV
jgi:N-dimethylarginine dimethylaminohydrolase